MFSIRLGVAAITLATVMSTGTALAARTGTAGSSSGVRLVTMNETLPHAPSCGVAVVRPAQSTARHGQSATTPDRLPTFTPWLNITLGQ